MSLSSKGTVYEFVTANANNGALAVNLPAGQFKLNTSVVLSVSHVGAPVANSVAYVRSIALSANTNVATITLNSTDNTYALPFKLVWNTPN
jgi:hypothetical protein